ncbi:golgin subfamily a member 1 [Plakobranchus ocellatus]|uniref:Golgin subfamily a member 1 n=1 Tax=Plakobranchus ocellatus TaxID=259542 RepID=A0AAV4BAG3_9GAST|nr:golgin subfamily a member 1 [Plakobranchus ocellatus]
MFAKLKKKIETDGGASPGKIGRAESVTSLPRAGSTQNLGPSPPGSVTSEDPSIRDVTIASEETARLLLRKTEQCKKLEGNISDLAALIKDKGKTIEKLEAALKQQEDVTNKKLQEQKEEFQKYRDKLVEGYQEDKLKLDKLINTEEALTATTKELEVKSRQCQAAETQVEKLTDELGPLKQRLASLEAENVKLKEEVNERSELVMVLTKEKVAFDKRLDELNNEMTNKLNQVSKLEEQLSDLDNEHKTYMRNSDIQRNKSSKLLQEKDEHIGTLQERIQTLEQRVSNSSLSGDDRTAALEVERTKLEEKLEEARQQLTEVKSSWSDKITHLEQQISHLNTKIVEDSEELVSSQRNTEQMREKFHKQIEDLREKLEEAEKRAFENLEVSSTKDTQYGKQIQILEHEINTQKLKAMDNETQLRAKISLLESELAELERARQAETNEAKVKRTHFEEESSRFMDKELKLEEQIRGLEGKISEQQNELSKKAEEVAGLMQRVEELNSAQDHISSLEGSVAQAESRRDEFERHLKSSETEKEKLLERNADLLQQIQTLKSNHSESKLELQRVIDLKTQTIEALQKAEAAMRQRLDSLERQIDQTEIVKAESGLYSERIDEMTATIATLQAQLTEKNRMLKKQEQTLKDLRVTLQRELKVQALPNDEPSEPSAPSTHDSTQPIGIGSAGSRLDGGGASPNMYNSSSSLQYQNHHMYHHQHHHPNMNQSNFVRGSSSPPSFPSTSSSSSSNATNPSAAVLAVQSSAASPHYGSSSSQSSSSSAVVSLHAQSPSVPSGAQDSLTAHTSSVKRDLDKDVNFLYLKHVVLKFMLSREAEAIQLIKAVSMLLNFSHQEQQLIKDTLEWKMSWFGHRPPLGKGQKAKVIPPTL